MKAEDRGIDRTQNIGNYQSRFEMFIKGLKMDAFEVFGYARNSPHNLASEALKNKNLYCDLVQSLAKSPILSRDISNADGELTQVEPDDCAGITQKNKDPVVWIVLAFCNMSQNSRRYLAVYSF
ncbi:uncharacterized protein BYT42DRAFT_595268 [Radiomyces spectabilis]|uniref:uncharacterized protein n=1 Tax=Radiomyces spectabilis TaxID=64574 RepID=UPI00221F2413|nr:uncharacterized protein BYT42DRAFT_595268 [Radiomyces spectabilis]KAI8370535.1 hypothetical protein BYT42DRAFT_595268 [Radiomyces spectabilis]